MLCYVNMKSNINLTKAGGTAEGSVSEGQFQYLQFRVISKRHREKAGNP